MPRTPVAHPNFGENQDLPERSGPFAALDLRISAPLGMLSHIEKLVKLLPIAIDERGPFTLTFEDGSLTLSSEHGIPEVSIQPSPLIRRVSRRKHETVLFLIDSPIDKLIICHDRSRSDSSSSRSSAAHASSPYTSERESSESSGGSSSKTRGENGW
jgi:hypothetical protein